MPPKVEIFNLITARKNDYPVYFKNIANSLYICLLSIFEIPDLDVKYNLRF